MSLDYKAIATTFGQLSDKDQFQEISEGLEKIYEHCIELNESSKLLADNKQYRAFNIINYILKEEAAKYLILVDALRCPNKPSNKAEPNYFIEHLKKFNNHLAKGIYALVCNMKFSTYQEFSNFIESQSDPACGLTGEEDDWIVRNRILSERDDTFYVSYTKHENGDKCFRWSSPDLLSELASFIGVFTSVDEPIIKMIKALHSIGISKDDTMKTFSEFWREFKFDNDTPTYEIERANKECLDCLKIDNTTEEYGLIINNLIFPLYKEKIKDQSYKATKECVNKMKE